MNLEQAQMIIGRLSNLCSSLEIEVDFHDSDLTIANANQLIGQYFQAIAHAAKELKVESTDVRESENQLCEAIDALANFDLSYHLESDSDTTPANAQSLTKSKDELIVRHQALFSKAEALYMLWEFIRKQPRETTRALKGLANIRDLFSDVEKITEVFYRNFNSYSTEFLPLTGLTPKPFVEPLNRRFTFLTEIPAYSNELLDSLKLRHLDQSDPRCINVLELRSAWVTAFLTTSSQQKRAKALGLYQEHAEKGLAELISELCDKTTYASEPETRLPRQIAKSLFSTIRSDTDRGINIVAELYCLPETHVERLKEARVYIRYYETIFTSANAVLQAEAVARNFHTLDEIKVQLDELIALPIPLGESELRAYIAKYEAVLKPRHTVEPERVVEYLRSNAPESIKLCSPESAADRKFETELNDALQHYEATIAMLQPSIDTAEMRLSTLNQELNQTERNLIARLKAAYPRQDLFERWESDYRSADTATNKQHAFGRIACFVSAPRALKKDDFVLATQSEQALTPYQRKAQICILFLAGSANFRNILFDGELKAINTHAALSDWMQTANNLQRFVDMLTSVFNKATQANPSSKEVTQTVELVMRAREELAEISILDEPMVTPLELFSPTVLFARTPAAGIICETLADNLNLQRRLLAHEGATALDQDGVHRWLHENKRKMDERSPFAQFKF